MDETSKIIIFTFSGFTMLFGFLVIAFACIFTPKIRNDSTPDITNVVNNQNEQNNIDETNDNIDNIDNIIQNYRESLSPDIEEQNDESRNNIMISFTPHIFIRGNDGELYNPREESETDF